MKTPLKIKVCGLTTLDDVRACTEAGVDWVGLNFHRGSVRYVDLAKAVELRSALKDQAEVVGLFVDRSPAEVMAIAHSVGLDLIQLHGSEPPEQLQHFAGLRVIKAFRVADVASIEAIHTYLRAADWLGSPPYAILVDAYVAGVAGGTGVTIGDDLLSLIPYHPRVILAGGLTPENVAERLSRLTPWMIDVASGVESTPGVKCRERIKAFVNAAHRV